MIIHPDYDRRSLVNDICLIQIESIDLDTASVDPACLPTVQNHPTEGTICWAAGWGRLGLGLWKFITVKLPLFYLNTKNQKFSTISFKRWKRKSSNSLTRGRFGNNIEWKMSRNKKFTIFSWTCNVLCRVREWWQGWLSGRFWGTLNLCWAGATSVKVRGSIFMEPKILKSKNKTLQ